MSNIFDYVLFWHGDLSSILMVGSVPVQANVKQRVSIEVIAVCEETSVSVSLSSEEMV